jgi:transposase InsO family protein
MVDVVTGYSRRRAVLGRGQAGVHRELAKVIHEWPYKVWGLHVDNGNEFLTDQLLRFCREKGLRFTRSRPYRKNDNAHVEQKNRQYVREIVSYDRFDTPEAVEWLNQVYESVDLYANLFLPMRKVVAKQRSRPHVSKKYDTACTPFQRLLRTGAVPQDVKERLERQAIELNPLALHRRLEELLARGPSEAKPEIAAGAMDGING